MSDLRVSLSVIFQCRASTIKSVFVVCHLLRLFSWRVPGDASPVKLGVMALTVFASQPCFTRCLRLPSYGSRRLLAIFSLRMLHFTLLFMARDFSLVVRLS